MNKFDRKIKKALKSEPKEIPQQTKTIIEDTLNNLPEGKSKVYHLNRVSQYAAVAASIVIVFLFLLPNVSVSYANMVEDVPVLGNLIKVFTIRNYIYEDDNHQLDISVPQIDDKSNSASYVNKSVDELTKSLVNQFYRDLELNGTNGHGSISVDYSAITDSPEWFTLKLSVQEIAAGSNNYYIYYHIDKKHDKIVNLGDLFKDDSYKKLIEKDIIKQMNERMEEDTTAVYWSEDTIIGEPLTTISSNRNFYLNKNNQLVIAFDKYEITPGYMGAPEFVIEKSVFEKALKDEYKDLIK